VIADVLKETSAAPMGSIAQVLSVDAEARKIARELTHRAIAS